MNISQEKHYLVASSKQLYIDDERHTKIHNYDVNKIKLEFLYKLGLLEAIFNI